MHKVIAVLKQAHAIIRAVLFAMDRNRLSYLAITQNTANIEAEISTPLPHSILISILLLGEQIDTAFDSIYADPRFMSKQMM